VAPDGGQEWRFEEWWECGVCSAEYTAREMAKMAEDEMTASEMVAEFHERFGMPIADAPVVPPINRRALRLRLIREEFEELVEASASENIVGAADGLADLLYVTYGAALEWGIPIDEVFAEVHRSNLSKAWPDGTVHKREDGKILKPPTYSPADVKGALGL
jgi:predicted HAD superfamily Cof-like phosphohydrolase